MGRVRGRDDRDEVQATLSALRLRVIRNLGREAGGRARERQAGRLRVRIAEFECNEFTGLTFGKRPDDVEPEACGCTCTGEIAHGPELAGMTCTNEFDEQGVLCTTVGLSTGTSSPEVLTAECAGGTCRDEFDEQDLLCTAVGPSVGTSQLTVCTAVFAARVSRLEEASDGKVVTGTNAE